MNGSRSWLWHLLLLSLLAFGVLGLGGCGAAPTDETAVAEEALGASCGPESDQSCDGLTLGAVCEGTGHCRPDPDYRGSCDCIVPAPPPPPAPPCTCSGTAIGKACGSGGTCHLVTTGQILYCSC